MKQYKEEFLLSAETIDRLSRMLAGALTKAGADKRDVLRIRLSLEEILGIWLEKLEGSTVLYKTIHKFGRLSIEVCVEGTPINTDEDTERLLFSSRLLAQAGLALDYSYKNGRNCLTCSLPQKAQTGQMARLVTAILSALCLGFVLRLVPDSIKNSVIGMTEPIFNTILGILRAVSSPMIFLAVCWGIISIGDLATVGRIGKKLMIRMIFRTFAVGTVFVLLASPFFEIAWEKGNTTLGGFSDIFTMVLGIVPSDIVSPFLEGNALQIIFLGVCTGMALLILGERVSTFQTVIVQANEVVYLLMEVIGKFIPVFVFLSIFNLLLVDAGVTFWRILKVFVLAIPGCLLLMLLYVGMTAAKFRVNPVLLVKKLLPTYLIALSTGSSAAAFATNLETCTAKLGIPGKVANFAIPLGQVIYKPGGVIGFLAMSLCMAEYYDTKITGIWLVTSVLTAGLLAMAAPPIPGGALSIFTIMFAQLGIPGEAVAIAVALNSILDFIMTSSGLTCLQAEVTLTAGYLKMLDTEKLVS